MAVSAHSIPVRLPCKWTLADNFGDETTLIQSHGISNRQVVIVIEKEFTLVEGFLAKILRAPKYLSRPLDKLNSALWELMDGSRSFGEIVEIMEECYKEEIVPARERCSSSINRFIELNLIILST